MKKEIILNQFNKFLAHRLSFEDFEDWVVSHLQQALKSHDEAVIRLLDEADSMLIELNQGIISQTEFVEGILAQVRREETFNESFVVLPWDNQSSSMAITVTQNPNFTEQALEQVRDHFVFG